MSLKIANLAKNTSYYTFALILQKILSFTYFIILARALGPADLGKYYFAISLVTIFAIFTDLGLASVLTREVAKTKERAQKFLANFLTLKIILSVLTMLVLVIFVKLMGYPVLVRDLIYLSSACMILDTFTLIFFATIRGFHNLSFESIAAVVFQLIVLFFGLIFLKLNLGLRWFMLALVAASLFNFIYSLILITKKWQLKLAPAWQVDFIKLIIKITLPFGLFGLLQRVYTYFDTVLLANLASDQQVGLYQVAFKIIFALQFLPLAFTASLYPAMSSYWANNRQQLVITFERALNYLIIISLPIAFGLVSIADKVVLLFKTGFDQAVLPLQISMVGLIFLFLGYPVGSLLNACDRQKINTFNIGLTVIVSIILNLILIPKFQAIGASLTSVLTNIFMLILGLVWVPKIIKYRPTIILKTFFKALLSVVVMTILIIFLKDSVNIFLLIVLSALVYFFLLFLLGGYKKEDIISIYQSLIKKANFQINE